MRSRTSGGASASSPPDTGTCGSARASRSSRAGGTCRSCFDGWVNATALPTYLASWHADTTADHKYAPHLRIRQEDAPDGFLMPVPVRVELAGGGRAMVRMTVRGTRTEVELHLPAQPTEVEFNPLQSVLAEVKTEAWE